VAVKTIKTPAVIIGGGVAGLAAAIDLSRRGLSSLVVERGPRLGGRVADFCCKATDSCVRCGACRLADLVRRVAARPEIAIYTSAKPVAAEADGDGWRLTLEPQRNNGPAPVVELAGGPLPRRSQVQAGAVILAVGATPFDPSAKSRFGYRRVPGVVSALELEGALEHSLAELAGGRDPRRVAFIQCVGSRDESLGHLYCSRVCCGFALRMARVIQARRPGTEITFFHMDVQTYGRAWAGELAEMREQMNFVRAMPGEVTAGPGGPQVVYAAGGRSQTAEFDLVVLSQGMRPPVGAAALSQLFACTRTSDGFLGSDAEPVASGAAGVFIAGSARGPMSIVESIEHGAVAAAAAAGHLQPLVREAAHA